jgi:hypothetical protein
LRGGILTVRGWLSPSTAAYISSIEVLQRSRGIDGDVCEIGVFHGKSFLCLALGLPADQRAVAIDVFEDQELNIDKSGRGNRESFVRHLRRLGAGNNVDIIKSSSLDLERAGFVAAGTRYRMFSIDGGHTADVTVNDLRVAERTMVADGVVVLDDYLHPKWMGVITGLFAYWQQGGTLVPSFAVPNKLVLVASEGSALNYQKLMRSQFAVACIKRAVPLGSWIIPLYDEFPFVVRDTDGGDGLLAIPRTAGPKRGGRTKLVPIDYLDRLEASAAATRERPGPFSHFRQVSVDLAKSLSRRFHRG